MVSLLELAYDVTHYETAGPNTGRVVVLAAGFSVPAYIWDSLYQRLADSGDGGGGGGAVSEAAAAGSSQVSPG